jgi:hypothetical protein
MRVLNLPLMGQANARNLSVEGGALLTTTGGEGGNGSAGFGCAEHDRRSVNGRKSRAYNKRLHREPDQREAAISGPKPARLIGMRGRLAGRLSKISRRLWKPRAARNAGLPAKKGGFTLLVAYVATPNS